MPTMVHGIIFKSFSLCRAKSRSPGCSGGCWKCGWGCGQGRGQNHRQSLGQISKQSQRQSTEQLYQPPHIAAVQAPRLASTAASHLEPLSMRYRASWGLLESQPAPRLRTFSHPMPIG